MTDYQNSSLGCLLGGRESFEFPSHPLYPKLRIGTQLDAVYERLSAKGVGFSKPGIRADLPRVLVVFDCQCAWSHEFWLTSRSLENDINFCWYPVCVSRDRSVAQGAALIASPNPWDAMLLHQDLFTSEEHGLTPEEYPIEQRHRDLLWENARMYRKSGGTSVPLGVFKAAAGIYIPFFGDTTAEEIRKTVLDKQAG